MYEFSLYQACMEQTQPISHDSHGGYIRGVVGEIVSYHEAWAYFVA
jgi:hypothetical protein